MTTISILLCILYLKQSSAVELSKKEVSCWKRETLQNLKRNILNTEQQFALKDQAQYHIRRGRFCAVDRIPRMWRDKMCLRGGF